MKLLALIREFDSTCCGGTLTATQVHLLRKNNGVPHDDDITNWGEDDNESELTLLIHNFFDKVTQLQHHEVKRIVRQLASEANMKRMNEHPEWWMYVKQYLARDGSLNKVQAKTDEEKRRWLEESKFARMEPKTVTEDNNFVLAPNFYSEHDATPRMGIFEDYWKKTDDRYWEAKKLCSELGFTRHHEMFLLKLFYYRMHNDNEAKYIDRPVSYRLLFNAAWFLICPAQLQEVYDPQKLKGDLTWKKITQPSVEDILEYLSKILPRLDKEANEYDKTK